MSSGGETGVSAAHQKVRDYLCLAGLLEGGWLYEGCLEALHGYANDDMKDSATRVRRRLIISLPHFINCLEKSQRPGDAKWNTAVNIFFNQAYTANEYRPEQREERRVELGRTLEHVYVTCLPHEHYMLAYVRRRPGQPLIY